MQKGAIKKKPGKGIQSPLSNANGMLAALNPSGTIHVTGVGSNGGGNQNNSTISMGMMSTDFKSTMKHNSSNNSIQSTKKNNMMATIRKPTDFIGAGPGIKKNGNYMSPYSQKMNMKNNNDGGRN